MTLSNDELAGRDNIMIPSARRGNFVYPTWCFELITITPLFEPYTILIEFWTRKDEYNYYLWDPALGSKKIRFPSLENLKTYLNILYERFEYHDMKITVDGREQICIYNHLKISDWGPFFKETHGIGQFALS